jgi:hypothetical protein
VLGVGSLPPAHTAAPICARRAQLTDKLLPEALWALMNHGYEHAEDVAGWIEHHLSQDKPFGGLNGEALHWLQSQARQPAKIRRCIRRISAEAREAAFAELRGESAVEEWRGDAAWLRGGHPWVRSSSRRW